MHTLITITCICLYTCLVMATKPKQKGLVPGNAGPFQQGAHEQMVLYYDLNRDHKVDIITKSLDRTTKRAQINFYIWSSIQGLYSPSGSSPIDNYLALSSVMATTFKKNRLELILSFIDEDKKTSIFIRPLDCTDITCDLGPAILIPQIRVDLDPYPPTLISLNGQIALMFQLMGSVKALTFTGEQTYTIVRLEEAIGGQIDPKDYSHSSVGDYNGDCLTDLVLLALNDPFPVLEFYVGSSDNSYTYSHMILIQEPIVHFSIQDMNFDGKSDLVILLETGIIQIHYNTNPNNQDLCQGVDLPFDFSISQDKIMQIQKIDLGTNVAHNAVLLFGDYDNDGYDDLTITTIDANTQRPKAILLHNIGCLGQECGTYNPIFIAASSTLNLRTFVKVQIPSLPDIITRLSFIDIYQDGNLDLMAEIQVQDQSGRYLVLQPIYNNYGYDAFFMKISLLAPRNLQNLLINTEYIGGCTSFYVTLLSGQLSPRTGSQLMQTGQVLELPSIRFGLGRTNNYLETLTVNLPRKVTNPDLLTFEWSPIIPNSDIIILPPPVENPEGQWTLKVMIEPTAKMGPVVVFLVAVLVVLAFVIGRLSKKESLQDKQNQASFYTLLS